jgi:hypothetical protein
VQYDQNLAGGQLQRPHHHSAHDVRVFQEAADIYHKFPFEIRTGPTQMLSANTRNVSASD